MDQLLASGLPDAVAAVNEERPRRTKRCRMCTALAADNKAAKNLKKVSAFCDYTLSSFISLSFICCDNVPRFFSLYEPRIM